MTALNTYSGRKVLVTGASGFLGSHLCRSLCEQGAAVHGVSRGCTEDYTDGVRWWRGDMVDSERVAQIVRSVQPEIIFHLASRVEGSETQFKYYE